MYDVMLHIIEVDEDEVELVSVMYHLNDTNE